MTNYIFSGLFVRSMEADLRPTVREIILKKHILLLLLVCVCVTACAIVKHEHTHFCTFSI